MKDNRDQIIELIFLLGIIVIMIIFGVWKTKTIVNSDLPTWLKIYLLK